MAEADDYDVIVVGGGAMGLSAGYNCAKAGQKTLILERFNFFNQSGSSSDLVRMFRTMYKQDFMADLAFQTIGLWNELERDAGQALILRSGLLNFGDPNYHDGPEGNLLDPIANLDRLKMSYRTLTAAEIMRSYPFKDLPGSFVGVFATDNGCINVPQVLRSLHGLASGYGARLIANARVDAIIPDEDGVVVKADIGGQQTLRARRCILTPGSYINDILATVGLEIRLNIWEMASGYYSTAAGPGGTLFPSMWFQFLDPSGVPQQSNLFYGFPAVPWGPPDCARIAVDDASQVIANPAQRKRAPAEQDLTVTSSFVRDHCVGVDPQPCFTGTCLQTNVADNMFVLDTLPASVGEGHANVALFTAGWGFKFVPLIGRILSDLVLTGKTPYDISRFSLSRPGILSQPGSFLQAATRPTFSGHPY